MPLRLFCVTAVYADIESPMCLHIIYSLKENLYHVLVKFEWFELHEILSFWQKHDF